MEKSDIGNYLLSRIKVNGHLLTSIQAMREKLSNYPQLRQANSTDGLKYVIESGTEETFYTISLQKDALLFDVYSKVSPLYMMHEVLLRIMSIAAVLSEDYEFEMRGLFPYIVKVLVDQVPKRPMPEATFVPGIVTEDLILSKRINWLNKENMKLQKDLSLCRTKLLRALALLIINKYGTCIDPGRIAKEIGIDIEEIDKAMEFMPELGYKTLPVGHEKFKVIKL